MKKFWFLVTISILCFGSCNKQGKKTEAEVKKWLEDMIVTPTINEVLYKDSIYKNFTLK